MWNSESRSGFTIIEGIVVLTILLILGSSVFLILRNQIIGSLESDAEMILSRLEEAQSRALSGVDNKNWGIHFEASTTSPHFYVMFSGDYATSTATTTFYLSRFVEFEDPASGASKEIIFNKLSGTTASSSITIRLKSIPTEKRTIEVNAYGRLRIF
jgi:type II secretory pathway pseudopilin PulG